MIIAKESAKTQNGVHAAGSFRSECKKLSESVGSIGIADWKDLSIVDPRKKMALSEVARGSGHTGSFETSARKSGAVGIGLNQLSFSYDTIAVFDNLSITAAERLLVLRGPSGCGKTTLLKLCAGILHPTSGSVSPEYQKPVFISQEDALFPWLTGLQNIQNVTGVSVEQIKASPLYARIQGFLDQRAHQMSFGQRRLIEIARALLVEPDMLCLDEPFNFIDPPSRALIQNLLLDPPLHLRDVTILVSSHYDSDFAAPGITTISFDGALPVNSLVVSVKA